MSQLLKQSSALFVANVKSLKRRIWISCSMILSVTLVVLVLLGFLSMSNGFEQSLKQTGADDIAIALGSGAANELGSEIMPSQLHLLQSATEIARTAEGTPILSQELVVPVNAIEKAKGEPAVLPLRGIGAFGLEVRPSVSLVDGRMFTPGAREIVVGARLTQSYQGLALGDTITLGTSDWTVVGVFASGGSVFESEIFADAQIVQTLFNRPNLVQSARFKVNAPADIATLAAFAESSAQLALPIKSEREYFSSLAESTSKLILFLGWPLAVIMAIGAAIGALTTMYSSVSDRSVEIATLRTIGFSRTAAFVSTWLEAILLTAIGCVVGIVIAFLALEGRTASTAGNDQMQIGFQLSLSPDIILQAVILSLIIGAIGGGLPALNATRIPLRQALTGRA
ncbi:MAG: FtsX-like permease family protein [Sulfitobacter sp.]